MLFFISDAKLEQHKDGRIVKSDKIKDQPFDVLGAYVLFDELNRNRHCIFVHTNFLKKYKAAIIDLQCSTILFYKEDYEFYRNLKKGMNLVHHPMLGFEIAYGLSEEEIDTYLHNFDCKHFETYLD